MEHQNSDGDNKTSDGKDKSYPAISIVHKRPEKHPFISRKSMRPPKSIHKSQSLKRKLHIPGDHIIYEQNRTIDKPKDR